MLCDNCKSNEAMVYVEENVNGQIKQYNLCLNCAGILKMPFSYNDVLQGILGNSAQFAKDGNSINVLKCDNCGLTYNDFKKVGKFGCANCYNAFRDELVSIFNSIQSNSKHKGKIPVKFGSGLIIKREVEDLRKLLKNAIENEEYEQAAVLRDKIKGYDQ